jgi:hypothetical protein
MAERRAEKQKMGSPSRREKGHKPQPVLDQVSLLAPSSSVFLVVPTLKVY